MNKFKKYLKPAAMIVGGIILTLAFQDKLPAFLGNFAAKVRGAVGA